MKIESINSYQPSFKVWKGTTKTVRDYGTIICDKGEINGKKIEIFSSYSKQNKLEHKLYYLSDMACNWLKSKLVYFSGKKKYKIVRSERKQP